MISRTLKLFSRKKTPFKQQMTDSDCGAACLAMVSSHFGSDISVYTARTLCESFGPAESTKSIIRAARSLNFEAALLACDLDSIHEVRLPAVIHWEFTHFVVLERIDGESFEIIDPAIGRRRIGLSEFNTSFTGIAVSIVPGPKYVASGREKNSRFEVFLRSVLRSDGNFRKLSALILLSLALQGLSLVTPFMTGYLVDTVIGTKAGALLWGASLAIGMLAISLASVNWLRSYVILVIQQTVDSALLTGYFRHTLSLPLSYFASRSTAELQSRMSSNTVIRDALSTQTVGALIDVVLSIGYLIVLSFASLKFAFLAIALALLQFGAYAFASRGLRSLASAEVKLQAACQSYAADVFNGIATVKTACVEERVFAEWKLRLNTYLIAARQRSRIDANAATASGTLRFVSPLALLIFGASLVVNGEMSLGECLAFNTIATMALVPLWSLIGSLRQFQMLTVHAERIGDVWRHDPSPQGFEPCPDLSSGGAISFDSVSYRYPSSATNALSNVSFELKAGQKVGIVGPSGSGKSTIVSILLGAAVPTAGTVALNGVDLERIQKDQYHQQLAYVPQDGFVFDSSIRENIEFGNESIGLDEIKEAIRAACLDDYVNEVPMGMDARIGEFGARISGGQRQRVAIARAMARQPKLLVLDEATSSLDSPTEREICLSFDRMKCTQLIVSHRISAIMKCDLILVLDRGTLVARGTHDELFETNSFYRECCSSQGVQTASARLAVA